MDDAFGVSRIDGIADLDSEIENPLNRERLTMDVLAESLAIDELHGDEGDIVLLADVVDGADARMVESGRGVRFAAKAFQSLRVLSHAIGQEFQRDGTVQPSVDGLVDDTHSSSTEFLQDAEVRNGSVNHE